jgi:hypothetical protein
MLIEIAAEMPHDLRSLLCVRDDHTVGQFRTDPLEV